MQTFISILRGINVSGQKKIQMSDLKALYEQLGFKNVQTYIQSGNVIFSASEKATDKKLSGKIEKAIEEKYSFYVPVIIRTVDEMQAVIDNNHLLNEENIDKEKLHVTFLEDAPDAAKEESISKIDSPPDRFVIRNKEIYLYCPAGYGNTKLNNNFFENKLKVKATTRNWKTTNKLLELALQNK